MKVVVIGGTGLIGRHLTAELSRRGHQAVAASLSTGVNVLTGEGLAPALAGAGTVVDVSNSPSFEKDAVLDFFKRAGENLAAAEQDAGVKHHVVLSIVGTDKLSDNAYMRAKVAQEALVQSSGVPYTIVRATQFHEFVDTIAQASANGGRLVVPDADFQPIAAIDVARALVEIALAAPRNAVVEIAGPERASLRDFVTRRIRAAGDGREVLADPETLYFGARLQKGSLVPGDDTAARLGSTRFNDWLAGA